MSFRKVGIEFWSAIRARCGGKKKEKSRLKCGFGRETQFMEDEDEVIMPPVSAHGLYTELEGLSRALSIVGIVGEFKTKRACGIIKACHSCSK